MNEATDVEEPKDQGSASSHCSDAAKLQKLEDLAGLAAHFRDQLCEMQALSLGWNASLRGQLIDDIREADRTFKGLIERLAAIEQSQQIKRDRQHFEEDCRSVGPF